MIDRMGSVPIIGERLAMFKVPLALVLNFMTTNEKQSFQCIEGVIPGSVLKQMTYDDKTGLLTLVMAHKDYPPRNERGEIQVRTPIFHVYEPTEDGELKVTPIFVKLP